MDDDLKTYYVTKWWNSEGILEVQGRITENGLLQFRQHGTFHYVAKSFFHETPAEAEIAFRTRVSRKIESLQRMIAKLRTCRPGYKKIEKEFDGP